MPGLTPPDNQRATDPPQVSIVGMWTVGFYHPGNLLWDVAIEQSSDSNEITNDNSYSPAEENLCWGVWARVGNGAIQDETHRLDI
jgi:hypothetical protein